MHRLLLALGLLALLAAPAGADTMAAGAGDVRAVATFEKEPRDTVWRDLRLTVTRGGTVVWDRPVWLFPCPPGNADWDDDCGPKRERECEAPYCAPQRIVIRDLDADGVPEVLFHVFALGANCCHQTLLLAWDGSSYEERHHQWGHGSLPLVRDVDGDGRLELRGEDDAFLGFSSGAMFPAQIWRVERGRFVEVTRLYPAVVRREAARAFRTYRRFRAHELGAVGPFATWAAMQELLGKRRTVARELRRGIRRGWLPRRFGVRDEPLARALDRFLRSAGYRR